MNVQGRQIEEITDDAVEKALLRVERGQTNADDANLLRAVLHRLKTAVRAAELERDVEAFCTAGRLE